jgi:hypothetical protein
MSEKLVNLLYAPVDVSLLTKNTQVSLPAVKLLEPSISQNSLKVVFSGAGESAIPTTGKYKRLGDLSNTNSIFAVSVSLPFSEIRSVVDIFSTQTNFVRNVPVTVTLQENAIYDFNKQVQNVVNSIILVNKDSAIVKNSFSSIAETQSKTVTKPGLVSLISQSNVSLLEPRLFKPETIITNTEFSYITSFVRNFKDLVDATDDVLGDSNIDDDQYALVGKTLHLKTVLADTPQKVFSTFAFSQFLPSDIKYLAANKHLENLVQNTLINILRPNKRPVSIASTISVPSSTVGKSLLSGSLLQDSLSSIVTNKGIITNFSPYDQLSEIVVGTVLASNTFNVDTLLTQWSANFSVLSATSTTDTQELFTDKFLQELVAGTTQESYSVVKILTTSSQPTYDLVTTEVSYVRSVQEYIYPTDDVFGDSNIDDDQYAIFNKNLVTILLPKTLHQVYAEKFVNLAAVLSDSTTTLVDTIQQSSVVSGVQLVTEVYKQSLSESYVLDSLIYSANTSQTTFTNALLEDFSKQADKSLNSISLPEDALTGTSGKLLINLSQSLDAIVFFKFIERAFFNETTVSTDGFANNQNYFAEAYIEPGYVGTNTYFS